MSLFIKNKQNTDNVQINMKMQILVKNFDILYLEINWEESSWSLQEHNH